MRHLTKCPKRILNLGGTHFVTQNGVCVVRPQKICHLYVECYATFIGRRNIEMKYDLSIAYAKISMKNDEHVTPHRRILKKQGTIQSH